MNVEITPETETMVLTLVMEAIRATNRGHPVVVGFAGDAKAVYAKSLTTHQVLRAFLGSKDSSMRVARIVERVRKLGNVHEA